MVTSTSRKILIINPNTSQSMTSGINTLLQTLTLSGSTSSQIDTYTAPSGPASINNEEDALQSANIVFADLVTTQRLQDYDAFLVACYSIHPLVAMLQDKLKTSVHVTGIFEASISTSLSLLPMSGARKFGIVSTGTYWERELSEGVRRYVDVEDLSVFKRFKGVETTGLDAGVLHTAPPELVRRKMMEATRRLVREGDVQVVCLGCAGMAGLDDVVREALVEELGEESRFVHILDGVKAGVGVLEGLLRALPPVRV